MISFLCLPNILFAFSNIAFFSSHVSVSVESSDDSTVECDVDEEEVYFGSLSISVFVGGSFSGLDFIGDSVGEWETVVDGESCCNLILVGGIIEV